MISYMPLLFFWSFKVLCEFVIPNILVLLSILCSSCCLLLFLQRLEGFNKVFTRYFIKGWSDSWKLLCHILFSYFVGVRKWMCILQVRLWVWRSKIQYRLRMWTSAELDSLVTWEGETTIFSQVYYWKFQSLRFSPHILSDWIHCVFIYAIILQSFPSQFSGFFSILEFL